jgi:YesN/AraC family two-component response regulator
MINRKNSNSGYLTDRKVVSVYIRATGSNVQIFDHNFLSSEIDGRSGIEHSICPYCTGCNGGAGCREMHINAIREAERRGRPNIYQCDLGLIFWASSIYSEGKFSGALRGSGYLSDSVDHAVFAEKCNGTIPLEEFTRRVTAFPSVNMEKIQSLAEMLQLCAEFLSTGSENYHEVLRLRAEQQASISVLIEELKTKYPQASMLPGYSLDKERQLIASLHQGNKKETEKLLNEVLAMLMFSNPNQFQNIQIRALELGILLARTGSNNGGSNTVMGNDARYIKQIQEAKTIEEIIGTLHSIVENVAGQITSFQGIPHALAMRKAETYIRENLTRKITLSEIANVAGLSAPYFSTIFKEEMGENLSKYINRLRVEKASKMLLETNFSLSEISSTCCFQDQSWVSKIFKSFTGISPGKYRNQGGSRCTM